MDPDPHQSVMQDPEPHQSKRQDPDPHQRGKQDPDPHQRGKQDPDPHQRDADPQHWLKPRLLLSPPQACQKHMHVKLPVCSDICCSTTLVVDKVRVGSRIQQLSRDRSLMPGLVSTSREANDRETNSDSTGSAAVEPTPGERNEKKVFRPARPRQISYVIMYYFIQRIRIFSTLPFLI